MRSIETIGPADIERKQDLHRESETCLATLETIADILTGAALKTAGERDPATALTKLLESDAAVIQQLVEALGTPAETDALSRARDRANERLDAGRPVGAPPRDPLHWPIAFPEVFSGSGTPGFDMLLVGNPPFMRRSENHGHRRDGLPRPPHHLDR